MISKHISCKPENDNYKRLAQYIAHISEANKSLASEARTTLLGSEVSCITCRNNTNNAEKCLLSWCAGCEGSDNDYQSAIAEILDIQEINTRSKREKTYHLVVSLRMEDEGKLSEQDYQDIELEFAKALGFQTHQRHCGVHKNTDNLHMHIAYNMINPETYRRHEPFRDYYLLEKTCRAMEQKYNLSIDNGIEKDDNYKLSNNSASKESRTGEESFERYVIKHHDKIMKEIEKSEGWQSFHCAFAEYGLEVTQRGNGLSIKNVKGNQRLKLSKFDKSLSYQKLTEKYGNFQRRKIVVLPKREYMRSPFQKNAHESRLWFDFIKDTKQSEIDDIKNKWKKEKIKITGLAVTRQKQRELLKQAQIREKLEILELQRNFSIKTANWLNYLTEKAKNGDEKALEVLRSKKEVTKNEEIKIKNTNNYSEQLIKREYYLKKQYGILSNGETSSQSKKKLLSIELMKKITENFTHKIDTNGNIIFSFGQGAKIIDSGHSISFSDQAKSLAFDFARIKFGLSMNEATKANFKGNQIRFQDVEFLQEKKIARGFGLGR